MKKDLIARVRRQLASEANTKCEKAFFGFFVEYLRRLDIEDDEE